MSVTEITTDPPGVGIVGGRGKSAGQVAAMVGELLERSAGPVFVTGTTPDQRAAIRAAWPEARYHARLGLTVTTIADVGVAGLHRLLAHRELLQGVDCAIVAAGMDGALASVVVGLIACPVIALPTSIGYGTAFGGVAALVAMVSSCTPGVAVVNVDDGLGAALVAWRILRACGSRRSGRMP